MRLLFNDLQHRYTPAKSWSLVLPFQPFLTTIPPSSVQAAMSTAVLQTSLPGMTVRQGKVRDIYDFGDKLLFVASDRISRVRLGSS